MCSYNAENTSYISFGLLHWFVRKMLHTHQYFLKGGYINLHIKSYQTHNEGRTTPGSLWGYHDQYTILSEMVTVFPATGKISRV